MSIPSHPRIAVVGATGAVGVEMLELLASRGTPAKSVTAFASARSAGRSLDIAGRAHRVEEFKGSLAGFDVALYSAGSGIARETAPAAVRDGCWVIDNSSAFRMSEGVALTVPEVNPASLESARRGPAIIANPNCSTIIMLMAVTPIRAAFGVRRVVVSTYQAASGAGASAMDELVSQTRGYLAGDEPAPRIFPEPCAFNVFSHNSKTDPVTGRNVEEQKMTDETRKIWGDPSVRVSATCVRVPVLRAHAESINIELERPASVSELYEVLNRAPGVSIIDERETGRFPTSRKASGKDDVLVGRVRGDDSMEVVPGAAQGTEKFRAINLFAVGDQIRKGAALNAVQILESLLRGT